MKIETSTLMFALLLASVPMWAQTARKATLAEQKMCANRVEKDFNTVFDNKDASSSSLGCFYQSHFDAKANICHIVVTNDGMGTVVSDAFENTTFAVVSKVTYHGKTSLLKCYVEPPCQKRITCKSEGEFNTLVEKYLGIRVN